MTSTHHKNNITAFASKTMKEFKRNVRWYKVAFLQFGGIQIVNERVQFCV